MEGYIEFEITRESLDRFREELQRTNRATLHIGEQQIPLILSRDLPPDSIEFRTRALIGYTFVRLVNIGPKE